MNRKPASTIVKSTHLAACFGALAFVTWGLLTPDPLAVVRRSPLSILTTISDLLMHFGAYGMFSLVCCSLTLSSQDSWVQKSVVALLVVHGLGTELLQTWIPCRTCDPLDAMANMTGITAGAVGAVWLLQRRPEQTTAAS
ncbi:MAG: VanZ family protein [Fuerstiella sp.]